MAVPSTFADLSTTPGSNSGLISDATAVNQIDNHLQTVYALIASIYANSGNGWSSAYLPSANPSYTGTLTGGTGVVNLGSGQFYKAAGGDVGIGTATPSTKLDVVGLDGSGVQYRTGTRTVGVGSVSGEASLYWGSSTALTFFSGSERMRIDSSGNVGIGVDTTGGGRLNINGNITVLTGGRVGYLAETDTSTVAGVTVANYGATFGSNFTGIGGSGTALSGYYGVLLVTAGTERMRIDSSGNQINTPSNTPPTLTVNGQMNLTPTSDTNMRISYRGSDGTTRVANITLA